MTLTHIGVVVFSASYDVLLTFAMQLYAALSRQPHLTVSLLPMQKNFSSTHREELHSKQLQALIVFNSYFANAQERVLCDTLGIPTLFCLVDAMYHFSPVASNYGILAFIDRSHRRFAEERGYLRVLDLPHAVDAAAHAAPAEERPYGCAMFSSAINYQQYAQMWRQELPAPIYLALEETAIELLADSQADLPSTFGKYLAHHLHNSAAENIAQLPLSPLLQQLDLYVKGKGRLALLQGLHPIPVDLFGGGDDWHAILGTSCPHVTVHASLPYTEVLARMRQTKVILSNCESIRDGAHERIFAALAHGAAVATTTTPFLQETFGNEDGILFYQQPHWQPLQQAIERALTDEVWRTAAVLRGQAHVAAHHLWDHRAQCIVAALEQWLPLLPRRDPPAV